MNKKMTCEGVRGGDLPIDKMDKIVYEYTNKVLNRTIKTPGISKRGSHHGFLPSAYDKPGWLSDPAFL